MLCHVKSMKCNPTTTHTNDQPPPPACAMSMAYGMFFFIFLILLVLTNVLQHQVDEMRPNNHLHQPPTTPSCLCHVHGLNNVQNASFRPMVCFFFFSFILFISLLPTNVLPCQVNETRPENDPHQPPPTPFSLRHVLGLNDA